MTEFDPDKFLAEMRARAAATDARVQARLARLGAETRPRHSGERYRCSGPLAFLFDGEDPDVVIRDGKSFKKMIRVFTKMRHRGRFGTGSASTVTLPSGKRFRLDHGTGEVTKP